MYTGHVMYFTGSNAGFTKCITCYNNIEENFIKIILM